MEKEQYLPSEKHFSALCRILEAIKGKNEGFLQLKVGLIIVIKVEK